MTALQKVYIKNENIYPLREEFKGEQITINPNDFWRDKNGNKREFDIFEANDFRGQYHPAPIDTDGKRLDDARFYKKISLIPVEGQVAQPKDVPVFQCMVKDCKHVSPSPEELEAHTKVRHANMETLTMPEVDARLKANKEKKVGS